MINDMEELNKIKAEAIKGFVNTMVGAFESGFVDKNNPTLFEIHRVAQNHIKDNFDIETPDMVEEFGSYVAIDCGYKLPNESED